MHRILATHCWAYTTCKPCKEARYKRFHTSTNRPHEVDIIQMGPGKMGMCISPGRIKGRWNRELDADIQRIKNDFNADILVTLLTEGDMRDIRAPDLLETARACGLECIHFPIRDKFIPSSMVTFVEFIVRLAQLALQGKTLIVHCNGGKGRTGLVVACTYIVLYRSTVDEAIAVIRQARPGTLYNPLQILYAHQFRRKWMRFLPVGVSADSLRYDDHSHTDPSSIQLVDHPDYE